MNPLSYFTVSINIIFLASIVAIIGISYGKLKENGGKELFFMFTCLLIAGTASFIETAYSDFDIKHMWRNVSQIGYFTLPAASFNFVMVYTGVTNKVVRLIRIIFIVWAFISVVLIFTNNYHHLMRISVELNSSGKLVVFQTLLGKLFVTFNTLISLSGIIRLGVFLKQALPGSRLQIVFVIIGYVIPIFFSYTKSALSHYLPFTLPNSFSFFVGSFFILIGILKYELLSISPMALSWVLDEIEVGIIYTDYLGKIVSCNKFVSEIFGTNCKFISENKEWIYKINKKKDGELELSSIEEKYYKIKIHFIENNGAISLITDITKEKLINKELSFKAEIDSMTNILNRESFINKVEEILISSNNEAALFIIDIDNFKSINDSYGHMAGDYVIKTVVHIFNSCLRENDIIGRLGGDEFMLFVQSGDKELISKLANRLKDSVSNCLFNFQGLSINCSISIGVLISNDTIFKNLYDIADKALYEAKNGGRNKTVMKFHFI